jgi:Tudor domain
LITKIRHIDFHRHFVPGISFWRSVAPTNSEVMITEIVNQQALYVCPVNKCGIYRELLQKFAGTIPTYTKTPQPSEFVLATSKSGVVYRAKIQTIMSAVLGQLIDLDTGVVEELDFKYMAPANNFIRALPIYSMLVKVDGVDQLSLEDRILVAEYWKTVMDSKNTLILSYEGTYQVGVKLLNATTRKHFILDVQEMKVAKAMQALALREKTPVKQVQRFMINDLELRDISVGDQVKVSLVDVSAVNAGQLTICEFHKDNVELYEQITKAVNGYGKAQAAGDAYYPR